MGDSPDLVARLQSDPSAVVDLLASTSRRRRALRSAAAEGTLQDLVPLLSRYVNAVEEPDPAAGRWDTPHPGTVRADLLRAGPVTDELLDTVDRHLVSAPHRLGTELPVLLTDPRYDHSHYRQSLRRYRTQLRRLASGRGTEDPIPAAHVDDIVQIAADQYSFTRDRAPWRHLLTRCDPFSRQRVAAQAADQGRSDLLAALLVTGRLWDLGLLTLRLVQHSGAQGAASLVHRIEETALTGPRDADEQLLGRLRHILEELAWAEQRTPPIVTFPQTFWLDRPACCFRESDLLGSVRETLDRDRLEIPEARETAKRLHLVHGSIRDLHDTVLGVLA